MRHGNKTVWCWGSRRLLSVTIHGVWFVDICISTLETISPLTQVISHSGEWLGVCQYIAWVAVCWESADRARRRLCLNTLGGVSIPRGFLCRVDRVSR